jgi:phosphopantothenoylcysteine decarboxylase/phosphopantothenate--cysteine ligase
MSLRGKKVLIGMTGGIACYKIPYLVRDLHRAGAESQVVMTENATRFIAPLTLEAVSNNPVATDMFPQGEFVATRHIDLATWPDLIVIAPATANFLGKVASGIWDDLLTTVVCASPKPVLIAPAMNPQMWLHPATQKNAAYLSEIGYAFVGPEEGDTACDHVGLGRMSEPQEIFAEVDKLLGAAPKGQKKKS